MSQQPQRSSPRKPAGWSPIPVLLQQTRLGPILFNTLQGLSISVLQHREVPQLLPELTLGAFPRSPSEHTETCRNGFAAQDSPCCSHSRYGCHTPPRCPNKHIAALIKAAGFHIRLPAVTPPWAGASGTVTHRRPFSSLVVTLSINRRRHFLPPHLAARGAGASAAARLPALHHGSIAQHRAPLPAWGTQRTCSRNTVEGDVLQPQHLDPSPQHVCCQARGTTTPHPPAAFARGSPGCADLQVTAAEAGDTLPVPTSLLGTTTAV